MGRVYRQPGLRVKSASRATLSSTAETQEQVGTGSAVPTGPMGAREAAGKMASQPKVEAKPDKSTADRVKITRTATVTITVWRMVGVRLGTPDPTAVVIEDWSGFGIAPAVVKVATRLLYMLSNWMLRGASAGTYSKLNEATWNAPPRVRVGHKGREVEGQGYE